jgi:hypothetical protein
MSLHSEYDPDENVGLIDDVDRRPRRNSEWIFPTLIVFPLFILGSLWFITPLPRSVMFNLSEARKASAIPQVVIMLQTTPNMFHTRVRQIRETWGARVLEKASMGLHFIVGDTTDGGEDMIKSGCDGGYLSGICRLGFAIQYAYDEKSWSKYDWFLFADDDVYILPDNLQRMILAMGRDAHLRGHAHCVPGCVTDPCVGFCGGGGVLLSRHAIAQIVLGRDPNRFESLIAELQANEPLCGKYHDVSFGYFLEHNRTNLSMKNYLYTPYVWDFKNSIEFVQSLKPKEGLAWMYHYPSRGAMYWLDHMSRKLGANKELSEAEL